MRDMIQKFITVGAIAPSSLYLAARMAEQITPRESIVVVELGAGEGALTGALLKKIPSTGKLIAIEIDATNAANLRRKYPDARLDVITESALALQELLAKKNISTVDYVISGLPIGIFKKNDQQLLLTQIKACLRTGGSYVQFQYFLNSLMHIKEVFQDISIGFELKNIPPAFVITCHKA